jgi:putative MFS transporter
MRKAYVSDIIDQPGGMAFSVRILLFVGLAMVFDGFDYMIVSFTMPQITAEMQLGYIATGALASFSLLGMLIGGFASGYLADKFGRKHVMNISIMAYALLTVPVFFVSSYDMFAICRILSGVGVGAVIPLSVTMVSEYAPTRHRGLFVTATKTFMMLGWVIAGLTAMVVVPLHGWRICYLIGGFPLLYGILMHYAMPESVQWLLSKGRVDEVMVIVNKINARLAHPKAGGYCIEEVAVPPAQAPGQLRQVVSGSYIKVTLGIWLVAFTTCSLSYGLTNWMPTILMQSGYGVGASYGYTTVMNLLGCLGAVVAGIAADVLGRLRSAYLSYLLAGLSVLFTAVLGFGGWMLAACALMGFAINYSYMSPAPITIEAYPTQIRATGQACVTTVARIGGFLTPMIIGGALETGSAFSVILAVFLIPLALAAVITRLLIKTETRGVVVEDLGKHGGCAQNLGTKANS